MGDFQYRQLFTKNDIEKWVAQFQQRTIQALILLFQDAGEQFVRDARQNGIWNDQTGNLRSSIGYVIVNEGVLLSQSSFDPVAGKPYKLVEFTTKDGVNVKFNAKIKTYNGVEGSNVGKQFAGDIATKYPKGLVLIVCAGMDYARFVEAIESKDVITGAYIRLEAYLNQRIQKIIKRI